MELLCLSVAAQQLRIFARDGKLENWKTVKQYQRLFKYNFVYDNPLVA